MTENDADRIMYEGFREWATKIKGYLTCPTYEDIKLWRLWENTLYHEIEKVRDGKGK